MNLPTHHIEQKMYATKCLMNWNQNMVIIGPVTRISQNVLIAWNLPQMILKQFRNLERLDVLPHIQRRWFSNQTVFSVIQIDERRSKRKVFGHLKATTAFKCQGWKTVLEIAKHKQHKKTRGPWFWARFHSSYRRQYQRNELLTECRWRNQETQEDLEEAHIGQLLQVFGIRLKNKSFRVKEHETYWQVRHLHNYMHWKT